MMRVILQVMCVALAATVWASPGLGGKSGNGATAAADFSVTVVASMFSMTGWSGDLMSNLSPGYVYRLDPGPYASSRPIPIVNGEEVSTPIKIALIGGGSETAVALTFELPAALVNQNGVSAPCFFPADGLYCAESGERYDPNLPLELRLGEYETVTLNLGIVLEIPKGLKSGDSFSGVVTSTAAITGM